MRIDAVRPITPTFGEMVARQREEARARSARLPALVTLGGTGWHKPTPADRPVANDALWKRNGEIA